MLKQTLFFFFGAAGKISKVKFQEGPMDARLNYDELSTALRELEAVLNSRPLTYVTMK